MRTWRIADLLEVSTGFLRDRGSSSPRLDAELLLAEALGVGRVDLYTQYDRPLEAGEVDAYRELVARRGRREPIAYILGRASFRYLTLKVTPATLIPRPETEELVDAVLEWLRVHPVLEAGAAGPAAVGALFAGGRAGALGADAAGSAGGAAESAAARGGTSAATPPCTVPVEAVGRAAPPAVLGAAPTAPPTVVDVGTGSGAIALSLASEAGVRVLGVDVSEAALEVARENRATLGLTAEVELRAGDLLAGVPPGSLRVVVANLPYVTEAERGTLDPDVRDFEPDSALFAGADGLDAIRCLVPQAAAALGRGGALFLEVGAGQAEPVAALARAAGFEDVATLLDMSGKGRVVRAVLPGCPVVDVSRLHGPALERLRAALREGAIVGLPTDTVYGLAAAWDRPEGVARLFDVKGRGEESPVAVLFASVEQAIKSLPDLDPITEAVLLRLLPGPYTFVVSTTVPKPRLVGTADSLGVRVPDHAPLRELLTAIGTPLAATSANRSGESAAANFEGVDSALLSGCAAAFAGGAAGGGLASTVVDLRPLASGADALVLREGAVPAEEALGRIAAGVAAGTEVAAEPGPAGESRP